MAVSSVANGDSSFPKNVRPPIASYSPSMWGDIFTSFSLDDQVQENYAVAIEALKGEARSMLMAEGIQCFRQISGHKQQIQRNLSSDTKGLLSLYEAAHLRSHGEDILDKALAFTVHHLNTTVNQLESPLQDQDDSKNEQLLKLAKLDFNYLQNLYKKELSEHSRLVATHSILKTKLPYARDRVVECYIRGLDTTFMNSNTLISK
ncbi:hypothetical protein BUALT_Bualt02G0184400 [Buddleja alternifolia]|uniref:Terpene synthase N-terminal domain-containing protein n=1 Tax=Buddleja alternifolia TaxID=168488 RepID=A0AAV6YC20_9LAMI|nr:hypothetical protein BUALT_Bualt02G0184400 [Buddleja alternifolia]